ncbi:MAG: M14-type cytosolic carboxypeptidase [Polyangiales bacterium]
MPRLSRFSSARRNRTPRITADFDGGAIEIVSADDWERIELALRADTRADEFKQWFSFCAEGDAGAPRRFEIVNAGEATYPDAFEGYSACASYDGRYWFRLPTSFDGDVLAFDHTPRFRRVYYAYFAPYSLDRHHELLSLAHETSGMRVETIGETVEGRDLDVVIIGDEDDSKRKIWVIARQHPGETMAEWFAEGMLTRLTRLSDGDEDETVRALLERATIYLVPSMNPDGGVLGNLRTNAAGMNLNRAWQDPSDDESPEVLAVREAMRSTGVDLFLDVHGDERNPYCFLAGCEGNPSYSERIRELEISFETSLIERHTGFQDEYGYDRDEPGGGDLRTAGNWVGEEFDCLSFTVEMPFKDNANAPDEEVGWSPDRAIALGEDTLDSVLDVVDDLREEE